MYSDSEYYYEEESDPQVQYHSDFQLNMDDNQLYSLLDNDETSVPHNSSPPPQIDTNDAAIAYSTSINQTREFLQSNFNIPISSFRTNHVPGLIILRLQDISSIRVDGKRKLQVPHILYSPCPGSNFSHPELEQIMGELYKA